MARSPESLEKSKAQQTRRHLLHLQLGVVGLLLMGVKDEKLLKGHGGHRRRRRRGCQRIVRVNARAAAQRRLVVVPKRARAASRCAEAVGV